MRRGGGTGAGAPRSPEEGTFPTRCLPSRRPGRSRPSGDGGSSRFRRLGWAPGHATTVGSAYQPAPEQIYRARPALREPPRGPAVFPAGGSDSALRLGGDSRPVQLGLRGTAAAARAGASSCPAAGVAEAQEDIHLVIRLLLCVHGRRVQITSEQGIVFQVSSVLSLSRIRLLATPWTAARQASLSITNSGACSNSCPLSW